MKIAQLAPLYEAVPPVGYGGTERVVHWLTEELVRRGAEVDLFATADSHTSARLIPCGERGLREDGRLGQGLACHMVMIEEVLRRATKYDVIHSHIDYLPFSQLRSHNLPAVTTMHGRLDLSELRIIFNEFRDLPIVSISHAQRKPLPGVNWIGNVHHGLPETSYRLVERPQDYLVFVGRICPEKGVVQAIEIAKRCGLLLKIAAKVDPVDREYFERDVEMLLQQDFVEYLGEIGEADKQEVIGNALGLLFPITWPEPFGLVMIEAMACGTPVVAYHHGSVPEVIIHGLNGFICNDVDSAADYVRRLTEISRPECRRMFEQRFTAKQMADNYLRIYRSVIETQKSERITLVRASL